MSKRIKDYQINDLEKTNRSGKKLKKFKDPEQKKRKFKDDWKDN